MSITILHMTRGSSEEAVIILDDNMLKDIFGTANVSFNDLSQEFAGDWQIEGIWNLSVEKQGSSLPIGELLERA